MKRELIPVMEALDRVKSLLIEHGDVSVSGRLADLGVRLRRDDITALKSIITEATGGMGSLQDRYLTPLNNDTLDEGETLEVNRLLQELIRNLENEARRATSELES